MTCSEALERVFEYIDSSTSVELTLEIESHIAQCLTCHDRFQFEQLLKDRVRRSASVIQPEELAVRIAQLIARLSRAQ
jgi:anti-sigma factor (TIGR02949 family)